MSLPLFFHDELNALPGDFLLKEDTARHIVQVLRMQPGELLHLTDGKGLFATARITATGKKRCEVKLTELDQVAAPQPGLHLAIAFTKNSSRNEWLLEKATEMGVTSIIPLMAHRSERIPAIKDRWRNILIAAILQSRQAWLPELAEPANPEQILQHFAAIPQKLLAHCIPGLTRLPLKEALLPGRATLILIGPEGDFTPEEVDLCTKAGCSGIGLGTTRLRTETAAMVATAYFNLINSEV